MRLMNARGLRTPSHARTFFLENGAETPGEKAALHYKSFSRFFKCDHNSFHDIISCQYGKQVHYIVKPKPGHGEETSPPARNESHRETHSQWWMLDMCVKVWVCGQSINSYENLNAGHSQVDKCVATSWPALNSTRRSCVVLCSRYF